MATILSTKLLRDKAQIADDAFFALDKLVKRGDEYNLTIPAFELLCQAHRLLGSISIKADKEFETEAKELNGFTKTKKP